MTTNSQPQVAFCFFHFSKLPFLSVCLKVLFGHAFEGFKGFALRSLDWSLWFKLQPRITRESARSFSVEVRPILTPGRTTEPANISVYSQKGTSGLPSSLQLQNLLLGFSEVDSDSTYISICKILTSWTTQKSIKFVNKWRMWSCDYVIFLLPRVFRS